MNRVAIAVLVVFLLLAGCGAGSTGSDTTTGSKPKATKSAEVSTSASEASNPTAATFFKAKHTRAINKSAAAAQRAAATAASRTSITACNKIDAYPAWRRCWHALLDPYTARLEDLVAVLTHLETVAFPDACQAKLATSAQTFTSFAGQVKGLLAGIDSKQRSKQVHSAKRYGPTLGGITRRFAKPFQRLTQVCYSPKTLASISASPSPTP